MQLFCQSCQAAFSANSHCPRCGNRLLSPQESFIHSGPAKKPLADPIPATFGNRLIMGVLVALGLAFGFRELASAEQLLAGYSVNEFWSDSNTDATTYTLRLAAIVAGGLIAGAGRRHGLQVGAATGLIFGGLLTAVDLYAAGRVNDLLAIILAGAFPFAGAVAAAAGAWVWPADAVLPEPVRASSHGSSMARLATEDADRRRVRPTAWLQISVGAMIVLFGTMASDPIRIALSKYSGGWLNTGAPSKAAWIGLEIATMATLLGGLIAGAGTGTGLKHGVFAGILAGVGMLIGSTNRPNGLFPPVEGYLTLFGITPEPITSPRVAMAVLAGLLAVIGIGGWLGGQLFPPLAHPKLRKRKLAQQS